MNTVQAALKYILLGLFVALCHATPAWSQTVYFGSSQDGFGGFTAEASTIVPTPAPGWTGLADSVRFTNATTTDSGQVNSALLRQFFLNRADGFSYSIIGVADWVSTYAADNNRLGISLFATSANLAGADSGLSLQVNIGTGTNQLKIASGINGAALSQASLIGVTNPDLIGQTLTYVAEITFNGLNIDIDFTLSAPVNSYSQTISTSVLASSYLGENFGFSSRGRLRNTTAGVNDIPFIYEAESFAVVPEPATSTLLIGALGLLLLLRRRISVRG